MGANTSAPTLEQTGTKIRLQTGVSRQYGGQYICSHAGTNWNKDQTTDRSLSAIWGPIHLLPRWNKLEQRSDYRQESLGNMGANTSAPTLEQTGTKIRLQTGVSRQYG